MMFWGSLGGLLGVSSQIVRIQGVKAMMNPDGSCQGWGCGLSVLIEGLGTRGTRAPVTKSNILLRLLSRVQSIFHSFPYLDMYGLCTVNMYGMYGSWNHGSWMSMIFSSGGGPHSFHFLGQIPVPTP